jgi:hypothetical protein
VFHQTKEAIKKTFRLLRFIFSSTILAARERKFIAHNRRIWPASSGNSEGEVLVEVFSVASCIVAQSYLVNYLAEKHKASITAYNPNSFSWVKSIYGHLIRSIYRSFGSKKTIYVNLDAIEKEIVNNLMKTILPRITTKQDVEDLSVDGVWIGDLLYDSYLMDHRVPTVDVTGPEFRESLQDALSHFVFWRNYLERNKVAAIVVSHCVYYPNAIILRLGADKKIPCYHVSPIFCYSLNKKYIRSHNEFHLMPHEFSLLPLKKQEEAREWAKRRLEMRFNGAVGVDMFYSTKSAYGSFKAARILKDTPKLKILIAPHCFFDSPHSYGNNLFTDFWEWLQFLGRISEKTDYEWYIKNHPDVLPENFPIIESIARQFPKFNILPRDSSHKQLIAEGISVVLTVYGTIAGEYAALGLPAINASLANPHVGYNFNLHIGDKVEYEKILMNLDGLKLNIDKDKVYEFYYMWHKFRPIGWLYSDYNKFVEDIGGHNAQAGPVSYEYFLNEFSEKNHRRAYGAIKKFVDSEDYCMFLRHMADV